MKIANKSKQMTKDIVKEIEKLSDDERLVAIQDLREGLHKISPIQQPVDMVRWVLIDMVQANDYNPNSVAKIEMGLLYKSIKHDGYTQPIVTIWDKDIGKYIIVDGFHRYFTTKHNEDIFNINRGRIPIVVIEKDINERMAATVRHNRARGAHSVQGMSSMVFQMLENGWKDAEVCNHLGMEAEELLKLKHLTGFSKLFKDSGYKQAWEHKRQIIHRKEFEASQIESDE